MRNYGIYMYCGIQPTFEKWCTIIFLWKKFSTRFIKDQRTKWNKPLVVVFMEYSILIFFEIRHESNFYPATCGQLIEFDFFFIIVTSIDTTYTTIVQ